MEQIVTGKRALKLMELLGFFNHFFFKPWLWYATDDEFFHSDFRVFLTSRAKRR